LRCDRHRQGGEHDGDRSLVHYIEVGGALIEEQYIGFTVHFTRQKDGLALRGRQRIALIADQRLDRIDMPAIVS